MITREELEDWLVNELDLDKNFVTSEEKLYSKGYLNSFKIVKLVRFLEESNNRKIPNESLEVCNFESVESILKILE